MKIHEFPIPANLNGSQLKSELGCEEVYILENVLVIAGDITQAQAKAAIAAHVPAPIVEPTIVEKLESVGLSIPDLKAALGL